MTTPLSFNANWYLSQNPDVAAAIQAGAPFNAFEHFSLYGRVEGRSASPLFDPQEYLSNNPDVAEAVAQGLITAWDHFELFGGDEGRSPTPLFNEAFYLQQNPDVAAAIEQGIISSAAQHFALFGANEPRAINPVINLGQYLNANPDIAEAASNGLIDAFQHLLQFGVNEGRPLGNGVSLSDFSADPGFTPGTQGGVQALLRVEAVAPFLPSFERPAGWTPPANTPIPVDFVPPAGSGVQLVIPPEVVVPDDVELPEDVFVPVTPVTPPSTGGGGTASPQSFTLTEMTDIFSGATANDTFSGSTANLGSSDRLNGGGGTDTLNLDGELNDATGLNDTTIKNIEIINLKGNNTDIDAARFGTAVEEIWQIDSPSTSQAEISNIGQGQTAGFKNSGAILTGNKGAAVITGADDTTTISIQLDNVGGTNEGTHSPEFTTVVGGKDVDTLNISGTFEEPGAKLGIAVADPTHSMLKTINVQIDTAVNLALYTEVETWFPKVETLNAALSTGALDISGLDAFGNSAVNHLKDVQLSLASIQTGSGDDKVAVRDNAFSEQVSVSLGAGDDTFQITLHDTLPGGTFTVSGGDGNDIFKIVGTASQAAPTKELRVNDYESGDVIDLTAIDSLSLTGEMTNRLEVHTGGKWGFGTADDILVQLAGGSGIQVVLTDAHKNKQAVAFQIEKEQAGLLSSFFEEEVGKVLFLTNIADDGTIDASPYDDGAILSGGDGDQTLITGKGNDVITGGKGDDTIDLTAQDSGSDTLLYSIASGGKDTILGFRADSAGGENNPGQRDIINFIDANADNLIAAIAKLSFIENGGGIDGNTVDVEIDFGNGNSLTFVDFIAVDTDLDPLSAGTFTRTAGNTKGENFIIESGDTITLTGIIWDELQAAFGPSSLTVLLPQA